MKIIVFTTSIELYSKIASIVPREVGEVQHVVSAEGGLVPGTTLALVDGKWGKGEADLIRLVERLAASAVHTVLIDEESHVGESVPELLSAGLVDDLLLTPIRPMELLSKIRHTEHLMKVAELAGLNSDLKTLIGKLEEDIRVARGMQRFLIPEKFPAAHGFKVTHKYLSGFKSGGDYLDFFEFEDKTHIGILMSDSSGYGLSSAFMSVILKLTMKLSKEEARSPAVTVARIFDELQITMKPKENLSIFYGVLNRKTFEFSYVSGGTIRCLRQGDDGYEVLEAAVAPLSKGEAFKLKDKHVLLQPGDRLTIMSDGFGDVCDEVPDQSEDAMALLNELSYRIKKSLESEDDLPPQDCSIMVIDVERRAMRLAK